VTTLAAGNEDAAVAARKVPRSATWWPRLRPLLLAVAFPAAMLAIWHFATVNRPGSLIPQPCNAATHSRRCQSRFELGPLEETKSALHAPL